MEDTALTPDISQNLILKQILDYRIMTKYVDDSYDCSVTGHSC